MYNPARAEARKIHKKYCIQAPCEIQLERIANAEHLIIEEADLDDFIGFISYGDNYGLIKINSKIRESIQKRFIIAHEMGHYFNHNKNGKGCLQGDLYSYSSQVKVEAEANAFASELLMPEGWVKEFIRKTKPGKDLLQKAAEYFNVSLSAAGIKIAETGGYPIAVIMSKAGRVEWKSINKDFPFQWIPKGYEVNNNSYAFDIFQMQEQKDVMKDTQLLEVNNEVEEVLADAWFWEDRNYKKNFYMYEQNINMPAYKSVLTLLWV